MVAVYHIGLITKYLVTFFFLKVTDEVSINAIINAMSLLSTLGESTNIAIPLLVLQSPRVCYQVMILGGRFI